jgi:hypothetical protein
MSFLGVKLRFALLIAVSRICADDAVSITPAEVTGG